MPRHAAHAPPSTDLCEAAMRSLERIRRDAPAIHCLTNTVAQSLTANLLLAAGAIPAMSMALDEIDHFIGGSAALTVNLGMLDEPRRAAIARAVRVAAQQRKPWVLDPVMVDRSPLRLEFAKALLRQRPAVVRGNADEISALAGPSDAKQLAREIGAVVAETGRVDVVSDGSRALRIEAGDPLMTRVSGLGCAASALVAAFCAMENDPFAATAQALLVLGVAGEMAAEAAGGPGSFQAALLDRLYNLDPTALVGRRQ